MVYFAAGRAKKSSLNVEVKVVSDRRRNPTKGLPSKSGLAPISVLVDADENSVDKFEILQRQAPKVQTRNAGTAANIDGEAASKRWRCINKIRHTRSDSNMCVVKLGINLARIFVETKWLEETKLRVALQRSYSGALIRSAMAAFQFHPEIAREWGSELVAESAASNEASA